MALNYSLYIGDKRINESCQVSGCRNAVPITKAYYKRYKICLEHATAPELIVDGKIRRWCQQCGKFESLMNFDGLRRTCRMRLAMHNEQRKRARKTKSRSQGEHSSGSGSLSGHHRSDNERQQSESTLEQTAPAVDANVLSVGCNGMRAHAGAIMPSFCFSNVPTETPTSTTPRINSQMPGLPSLEGRNTLLPKLSVQDLLQDLDDGCVLNHPGFRNLRPAVAFMTGVSLPLLPVFGAEALPPVAQLHPDALRSAEMFNNYCAAIMAFEAGKQQRLPYPNSC